MQHTVHFDIETIPSQLPWVREYVEQSVKPPATIKKPESIAKWQIENKAEAIEDSINKMGFSGAANHIVTIAWAVDDGEIKSYQVGFNIGLTGFDENELEDLLGNAEEGLTDEDDVPPIPVEPVSQLGDVWILGEHRLMCGDSTDLAQVEILMGGGKADMVFTDPPYNVNYSGRGQNNLGTIENDDMDTASFNIFLDDVFNSCLAAMKPLAPIYVCHPDSLSGPKLAFERSFAERFRKSSTIIWMKQSAGMGWQDYRAQHEPILYGWKEGKGKHYFCKDRTKTTVWQIGRDAQSGYVHPTQKPVALPEEAIQNSSKKSQVVLDLFGGSGSTLIACEKTDRKARLMELDPIYVDVIIHRFEQFTGKSAILEATGKKFSQVEKQRKA